MSLSMSSMLTLSRIIATMTEAMDEPSRDRAAARLEELADDVRENMPIDARLIETTAQSIRDFEPESADEV